MHNPLKSFVESDRRKLKHYHRIAEKIEAKQSQYENYSDEQLKAMTDHFRSQLKSGTTLDQIVVDAFAVCREAAYRVLHMRPFHVQIIGGLILNDGNLAEMKTGEGKTLTATMPVYLNALTKKGVHVITVNEYLSKRDAEEMGVLYHWLGLSVGVNGHDKEADAKRKAYQCDILYSTNADIGFDYLRDNMAESLTDQVQRPFYYGLVDEVDSVLIDEAKTPLVISGGNAQHAEHLDRIDRFVKLLQPDFHFKIDPSDKTITLTKDGIRKAEAMFDLHNLYDRKNGQLNHEIQNALQANFIMFNDKDYLVDRKDQEIKIIDSFTGRAMSGRRFSQGLHQALEAKEHIKINDENKTMASITYQSLFRMYPKLAGMTGTGKSQIEEFRDIYHLDLIHVPTHKPVQRIDHPDRIYLTLADKFNGVLKTVEKLHANHRPILIGTASVKTSERLSKLFDQNHLKHTVLNAKDDDQEANIVKQAGQLDAITIATNMASRGTDIKLPAAVKQIGGLAVIGTERHESKRIDDQLRGRAGRQGDVGSSQFFVSFEDDLLKQYVPKKMQTKLKKLKTKNHHHALKGHKYQQLIETAQQQVEGINYSSRKDTMKYDLIMLNQRNVIYKQRNQLLHTNVEQIETITKPMLINAVKFQIEHNHLIDLVNFINQTLHPKKPLNIDSLNQYNPEQLQSYVIHLMLQRYTKLRAKTQDVQKFNALQKKLLLELINDHWADYIDAMQQLQDSVQLRTYAQKDPVLDYQYDSFKLFETMIDDLNYDFLKRLLNPNTTKS